MPSGLVGPDTGPIKCSSIHLFRSLAEARCVAFGQRSSISRSVCPGSTATISGSVVDAASIPDAIASRKMKSATSSVKPSLTLISSRYDPDKQMRRFHSGSPPSYIPRDQALTRWPPQIRRLMHQLASAVIPSSTCTVTGVPVNGLASWRVSWRRCRVCNPRNTIHIVPQF